MVGQAGDRSDEAIRELARAAWSLGPDHVVVKEMDEYLRGRAPGEVPALLAGEFLRLGLAPESIHQSGPDLAGVRTALEWARPGDLLVLAVHQDRTAIVELLNLLVAEGWQAGASLPSAAASSAAHHPAQRRSQEPFRALQCARADRAVGQRALTRHSGSVAPPLLLPTGSSPAGLKLSPGG